MHNAQFRCEVGGLDTLRALVEAPLPCGLTAGELEHSFHRDLYLDTPDRALGCRQVACRFRTTSGDERVLALLLSHAAEDDDAARFEAVVDTIDPQEAVLGDSEPARRLRALVDPKELRPWLQLETERWSRIGKKGWFRSRDRVLFVYDNSTVRAGGLSREFQEVGVRRLVGGRRGPSLARLAADFERMHGLRPTPFPKHERALSLLRDVEGEALARAVGSGRAVGLLVQDGDTLAFHRQGERLELPVARGSGEEAARHLLHRVLGSAVGDLLLLGVAPGSPVRPALEVWSARRIRTDGDGEFPILWLPLAEVVGRIGEPMLRTPETLAALALLVRSSPLPAAVALRSPQWPAAEGPPAPPTVESGSGTEAVYPPEHFLNVEVSQLAFHERVLELAEDRALPLLERLRYLAIVSSNLDEFFAVRVGALKERALAHPDRRSADGLLPSQELDVVAARVPGIMRRQLRCLDECLYGLEAHGVRVRRWGELDEKTRERMRRHFRTEVLPDLTPRSLMPSPGHPFPIVPNLALAFGLMLRDDPQGPFHFAYLRLPDRLPRFVPLGPPGELLRLEELVQADLPALYPDRIVEQAWLFRVTRSADLDVEEEEAGDLLQAIEEEVSRRALNPPVRVELQHGMPAVLRDLLLRELRFEPRETRTDLEDTDLYAVDGILDLTCLRTLADLAARALDQVGRPAAGGRLTFGPPRLNPPLAVPDGATLFDRLRERDLLVHHPYDPFEGSVLRFLREASEDPIVSTIKMTLYRAGDDSPVVDALCRAAARGKEVAVFVELKARFDETRNIAAVERMEGAGVQVIYGVVGVKNHAKTALVVRREPEGVRRYAHIGSGNYNASTARFYTDLGLLTADPDITADLTDLFNQLTGTTGSPRGSFRRLLVAPATMLASFCALIGREEAQARAGRPARIRAQINGLEDPEIIEALYRASTAGVEIDLLVRSLCALRPGLPGCSERIRVRSLLGRYLEHARIFHFANGGADEYYLGSADWRPRNLRRRVEVVTPVRDPALQERLDRIFRGAYEDPSVWTLDAEGTYHRLSPRHGAVGHIHDHSGELD